MVFLVDDNPSDVLLIQSHLAQMEVPCSAFTDPYEALEHLEDEEWSLFLVDLQMPKMTGLEFIKRLRAREDTRHTPIIIISSRNKETDVRLGVRQGAADYVVKPVDPETFKAKVQAHVKKEDLEKDWYQFTIDPAAADAAGYSRLPLRLWRINELKLTCLSPIPLPIGMIFSAEFDVLKGFGIEQVLLKVDERSQKGKHYQFTCTFQGQNENLRQQIRLACRKLYFSSAEKDEEFDLRELGS